MKICIDPGHSGPVEPGACAGDLTEAGLVILIANYVNAALTAAGHEVTQTRYGEIDSDLLMPRCETANDFGADLFVSIHCNAAESTEAAGVETYHFPDSAGGEALAASIQQQLVQLGYTRDRGVKEARFTVLEFTNMPAVLVECAFISSDTDRAILADPAWQQKIGAAIAAGVNAMPSNG